MKFRTSRELKNMILSINLAILTFFDIFLVSMYENLFIFYWTAIKIAGSAQKKQGRSG